MVKGPTGCGKSRFVEYMAWKLGKPLITVACNEGVDRFGSGRALFARCERHALAGWPVDNSSAHRCDLLSGGGTAHGDHFAGNRGHELRGNRASAGMSDWNGSFADFPGPRGDFRAYQTDAGTPNGQALVVDIAQQGAPEPIASHTGK